MNKILISLFVACLILVNCNLCLAQGAEADSNDAGTVSGDATGSGATADADKAAEPADANRQRHQRNLERIRQRRKQMLESRERTAGQPRPRAGRGGGPEKRLEQLRLQLERENEKHLRRIARINRIKELAAEERLTKVVERVDKLLNKEQQRHSRKQKRLQSEVRNLARSEFRRRQTERLKKGEPAVRGTGKRYLQRQKSRDAATNKKKQ